MRSYASCANDNARYTANQSAEKVIDKLKIEVKRLVKWFSDKRMNSNSDKCYLLAT